MASVDKARFYALLNKFDTPARASAAPTAPTPTPTARVVAAPSAEQPGSDDEEVSLGALRSALAVQPQPVRQQPPLSTPAAAPTPDRRLGKQRTLATPKPALAAKAQPLSPEEEGEEEEEEEEDEPISVNLRELARSAKKVAYTPVAGGGGVGADSEYDYNDGWLVSDDVCEYDDAEGSLDFEEEEEEYEEEEEEVEEEGEEEGSEEEENAHPLPPGDHCHSSSASCDTGTSSSSLFPAPRFIPPTPSSAKPSSSSSLKSSLKSSCPPPSFAGLKDGAPHPTTGLVLVREELHLPAERGGSRHAFRNRSHRDALTAALYKEYNARVFGGRLPPLLPPSPASDAAFQSGAGIPVEWRGRLTRTAGLTFTSLRPAPPGSSSSSSGAYCARIALSVTVLDSPFKLAQTLLHELCHAAVWVLSHIQRPPHGAAFQAWARAATQAYPLRPVTVCHNYKIEAKYSYACAACGAVVGRHSKSIASGVEACRACRQGVMVLQAGAGAGAGAAAAAATPGAAARPRPAPRTQSLYLQFLEAERGRVAREMPGLGPRETMAELARRWGAHKAALKGAAAGGGGVEGLAEQLASSLVLEVE